MLIHLQSHFSVYLAMGVMISPAFDWLGRKHTARSQMSEVKESSSSSLTPLKKSTREPHFSGVLEYTLSPAQPCNAESLCQVMDM